MITLLRPTRHSFTEALKQLGFEEAEAEALAVRTGCTLSAYRRDRGAFHRPSWATPDKLRLLIPAFLAGSWVDDQRRGRGEKTGDRDFIAALAGQSYVDYRTALIELTTVPDAQVMRVKDYWRITTPVDALHLIAPYLSDEHLETLHGKAFELLSQRDPALDLPLDKRYMAQVWGKVLDHSGTLREGVLGTLALLTHFTEGLEDLHTTTRPRDVGYRLVHDLLFRAHAESWLSLAGNLDDLAEVSPQAFLDAVEESFRYDIPPIMALFEEEGDAFTGGCHHASLLWGLEALAWEPRYLPRACRALAELAAHDPGGTWANRPNSSLRNILLPWRPGTFASLKDRMDALDAVLATQPEVGWSLLISLAPKLHDTTSGTRHPHWLPVSGVAQTPKTMVELWHNIQPILDRIEKQVGSNAERWGDLCEANLFAFPSEYRQRLLRTLIDLVRNRHLDEGLEALRTKVRQYHYFLMLQNDVASAEVEPLVELEDLLSPDEPMARHKWLFDNAWVDIPSARPDEQEVAQEHRSSALDDIVSVYGLDGIISFVEMVGDPVQIALTAAERPEDISLDELVKLHAKNEPSTAFSQFLMAYVSLRYNHRGWEWAEELLERTKAEWWPMESVLSVFFGFPATQETQTLLEETWQTLLDEYWKRVNLLRINQKDPAFCETAMEKALDAGRAAEVINRIGAARSAAQLSTSLICRALRDLAMEAQNLQRSAQNLGHPIKELFKLLDERDDISDAEIAALEVPFRKAFEHTDRSEMAFHRLIAASPSDFTTLITWLYKRDDGQEDDEEASVGELHNRVELSWIILDNWRLIPGRKTDGEIDEAELLAWVQEARDICSKVHRLRPADRNIGKLLANAPADDDGVWPCLSVRKTIQAIANSDILSALQNGLFNKRGVFSKGIYEGGKQERELAARYRTWAYAQRAHWPAVASVLDSLADTYEREAEEWDAEVSRRRLKD